MGEHCVRIAGERSLERFLAKVSGLPQVFSGFPFTAPRFFLELRRAATFERHELLGKLSSENE